MKRVKSETEKRLIVEVKVNGKSAYMLIDTGASAGIIDMNQADDFDVVVGNKYCVPVTLLKPISNKIGLIILINIATLSYPCPKNTGTNDLDTAITPKIIGNANKNSILNDFFI